MSKWTQKEKDEFLSHVEQHQCDTFEEEVEAAWESLYVEPDEPNEFPKRTLSACKSMVYKIIKEKREERVAYLSGSEEK
jgi:hypothetical protein